jgi:hypothetical protein
LWHRGFAVDVVEGIRFVHIEESRTWQIREMVGDRWKVVDRWYDGEEEGGGR